MEKKKILVIEDETTMREALQETLSEKGFEVETAADGEEGISKVKSFLPELILLDIILPKKDGFDVLKEIREIDDEKVLNVPVILLTNISGVENIQKALDLGATTYLVKADYKLGEIAEKVNEVIGK